MILNDNRGQSQSVALNAHTKATSKEQREEKTINSYNTLKSTLAAASSGIPGGSLRNE